MARLQARESLTPQLKLEAETSKEAVGAPIVPLKKALPFACNGRSLYPSPKSCADSRWAGRLKPCGSLPLTLQVKDLSQMRNAPTTVFVS